MTRRFLLMLFLTVTTPAWAGGSATVIADRATGPVALAWRDSETVRLDMPGHPGYMIVRDGRAYLVSSAAGQPVVMSMASMAQFLYGPNKPQVPATAANAAAVGGIEATGRSETVAGIDGEVHEVSWTDAEGNQRTDEAVLTQDPATVAMTAAFRGFVRAVSRATGVDNPDALGEALAARGLGILRFGQRYRLKALSAKAPDPASFALPTQPLALPAYPGGESRPSGE